MRGIGPALCFGRLKIKYVEQKKENDLFGARNTVVVWPGILTHFLF